MTSNNSITTNEQMRQDLGIAPREPEPITPQEVIDTIQLELKADIANGIGSIISAGKRLLDAREKKSIAIALAGFSKARTSHSRNGPRKCI